MARSGAWISRPYGARPSSLVLAYRASGLAQAARAALAEPVFRSEFARTPSAIVRFDHHDLHGVRALPTSSRWPGWWPITTTAISITCA